MNTPDRRSQALHALNCAIACMVAAPQNDENLGAAVFFASLALHRMAQADPNGTAATWAETYLARARKSKNSKISIISKEPT